MNVANRLWICRSIPPLTSRKVFDRPADRFEQIAERLFGVS